MWKVYAIFVPCLLTYVFVIIAEMTYDLLLKWQRPGIEMTYDEIMEES